MAHSGQQFGDLAMRLHDEAGVGATVDAVLLFALKTLNYAHASILLVETGKAQVAAATDPLVTALDQRQLNLGQGPSLSALTESEVVVVTSTAIDTRWPGWAPVAAAAGVGSVLAIRLHTATGNYRGVLNLIRDMPSTFAESELTSARLLALHASIALTTARREESLRPEPRVASRQLGRDH